MKIKLQIIILCILSLFLVSCSTIDEFEIETTIKPKILAHTSDSISIEYMLGPLLVLDDLKNLATSHVMYLKNKKNLKLKLYIYYHKDSGDIANEQYFQYSLGATELEITYPNSFKVLMEHSSKIKGFKWKYKDCKRQKEKSIEEGNSL